MICLCCGRAYSQLTRHHLIPRSRHKNKKTRKNFNRKQLNATIGLCDPCHNHIHTTFTEKDLEQRYHTLEAIKSNPEMVKFVNWIENKPEDLKPALRRIG